MNKSQSNTVFKNQNFNKKINSDLNETKSQYLISGTLMSRNQIINKINQEGSTGMNVTGLTKTIHSNKKKIDLSYQEESDNVTMEKDTKYFKDKNFQSEKNSTMRQTNNQKTFLISPAQKSQDVFLTNILGDYGRLENPKNVISVIEGLKGSSKTQQQQQLQNLDSKKESLSLSPSEKNKISPDKKILNKINPPSSKVIPQLKLNEVDQNPSSHDKKDYHKLLTIKNRNTVLNNIHKVKNKNRDHSKSRQMKDSLDIDSEDEIFDHLPEIELRNNLLDGGKSFNNSGNKFNEYVNLFKNPKRPQKRKKLFDKIYKIDDEFLDDLDKTKKNKDKYDLIDYQNKIFGLLTARMSKENLRKLSLQFKDVQELAARVQSIGGVDWDEITKQIENILFNKKSSSNSSMWGMQDKFNYNSESERNHAQGKRASVKGSVDPNKRLSNLGSMEPNKRSSMVGSVEPNKRSSVLANFEDVSRKLNTVGNTESKVDLPELQKNKKEYKSKRKISEGLKSRTIFLPSFLVEKFNKVLKIKN
jgi:hypothetical protein